MSQQWTPLIVPQHNHQKYKIIFISILCAAVFTYYIYLTTYFNACNHKQLTINPKTYYILQWTTGKRSPFYHMGTGPSKFIEMKCPHQNCYVTDNRSYLSDLKDFDAIVFNGNDVINMNQDQLPQERSPLQKFVFGATESAPNKMACNPIMENLFNWTWTYKLDSDVRWSYILIYNSDGDEIGPKPNMEWPMEMEPIQDEETTFILDGKSKAAAWFVTHCKTLGKREDFVNKVKPELSKLNLTLDVYGKCGDLDCPRSKSDECYDMVKKDYYFYFSFENSFATDYVTEKLLTALNNFAIPVVYGGADYSRFLPPGSYINARELDPELLASTMKDIIENRTRFYDYFRWRNHFRYKRGENDSEICNICTALNEGKAYNINLRDGFREWWNEEYNKRCKN
ncbi:alpha-(1,3)-fucosyltransferase C-like [Plodia interpunctella]|uniref:alpha-(1,3)-fucosyltransferase C-like n=1 Tax=Plodia interpunctella TaxID=58824 RepID=UPI0023683809|nr:alpha-(1,3)-fucosyltransferase C-like [Plodia interpunctella]